MQSVSIFCLWFSGFEACGILAPRPGIELVPPALLTGLPGKSPQVRQTVRNDQLPHELLQLQHTIYLGSHIFGR